MILWRISENSLNFVTGGFPEGRTISCPDDVSGNLYLSYFQGKAPQLLAGSLVVADKQRDK